MWLAITWLVGSCAAVWIAAHFMQEAYDRSLVEDALLVAERVLPGEPAGGGPRLRLTAEELRAVLFDSTESIFFSVYSANGDFIAGHLGLGGVPDAGKRLPYFSETDFEGRRVRSATIFRSGSPPFFVTVGQTTAGRDAMLWQLLTVTLLPQMLLLLLLIVGIRRFVASDLAPLVSIERDMQQRDAYDLSPVKVDSPVRDFVRLGDSFNALLATIGRGVEAQREFSGNIAHELRTPLSGIRALAEYGLRCSTESDMKAQLKAIIQTQDKASRLVDQLLALAFADEAERSITPEPVRLDTLVREVLLRFIDHAEAAGIDLGATGLDQPVLITANVALVEGMVNNLVDNACRHAFVKCSPADGAQITVGIDVLAERNNNPPAVVLTVSDNGSGLPQASPHTSLQRWHRGESDRMLHQGTGLGLSIVAEYARLLGAQFSLVPGAEGRGVVARIEFGRQGAFIRARRSSGHAAHEQSKVGQAAAT